MRKTAAILQDVYYACDVYRIGRDVFLIFSTELSQEEFNRRIETLRIRAEESEEIRFAIGSCYADAKEDVRDAMRLADERMYEDKEKYYQQHPED